MMMTVSMETRCSDRKDVTLWLADCLKLVKEANQL